MRRLLSALLLASAAWSVQAADDGDPLAFDVAVDGRPTGGWRVSPADTVFADEAVVHGGARSVRLERGPDSAGPFSAISLTRPIDFDGRRIELRGFVRTEDVSEIAGLFVVEDDAYGHPVAYDNMQARPAQGTADWRAFSVAVAVHPDARTMRIGALLGGTGKAWVDDLRLIVDGEPIANAPRRVGPPTAIETDRAFDDGSRIAIDRLSGPQVDALAKLGRVWGFLKYHHPRVASGSYHWDYELLRVVPRVLADPAPAAVDATLLAWIDGLGPVAPCAPCATLDRDALQMLPALGWLDDGRFGAALRGRLKAIARDRPRDARQFYLSFVEGIGNPSFDHEPAYRAVPLADRGFRLLAVYRFWNVVAYWFPYRDLIDEDWDAVLADALPRVVLAPDDAAYQRELMALIAKAHDTHANLWSSIDLRPPVGRCRVPVDVRFVDGRAIVAAAAPHARLAAGDEIVRIDGVPLADAIASWTRYYAVSNDASLRRDLARAMTVGPCGPARIAVADAGGDRVVETERVAAADAPVQTTHDLPGPTFRLLSPDVAYIKLSSIAIADIDGYLDAAANTEGLVIDIRNYPSAFVVFALGDHLVDAPTPFVRFTRGDAANPGAFHWTEPLALQPMAPHYRGRVVVLVDETSQSQAEYTTMAFRAAPGAVVVGSETAGADGNVSTVPLPGVYAWISGIGVFYPDRRPTQRVGIAPDVVVRPTVAGLRAGRDEVLEAGINAIVGAARAADVMRSLEAR